MHWLTRASFSSWSSAGKRNLAVMSAVFIILSLSLIFQPGRWHATPAYHVLLLIFRAQVWGVLFLVSGAAMGLAAWSFERHRWAVVASLTVAFTLTTGWTLAFVVRWLTSTDTTPVTWVAWSVFDYLLLIVAIGLDRPPTAPSGDQREISDYMQAVDDALSAAERDQGASLQRVLDAGWERARGTVGAACAAYGQALAAAVPAGAMPPGDLEQAINEARNAYLRAEEAYQRATGQPAQSQDPP